MLGVNARIIPYFRFGPYPRLLSALGPAPFALVRTHRPALMSLASAAVGLRELYTLAF